MEDDMTVMSDPFSDDDSSDSDEDMPVQDGSVDPKSLEGVVRRRRRELADRLARVYEGRKAKEVEKIRTGGTSNQEKSKQKNFQMVKESKKVRSKQALSLRQQQMALKKHIKTMQKTKKLVQKVRRRKK